MKKVTQVFYLLGQCSQNAVNDCFKEGLTKNIKSGIMWNTEPGILKPQVTPSPKKQNKTENEICKAKCTEINCW